MEFDITNLDEILVLKSLFAYSEPLGMGEVEYQIRNNRSENVIGLTDEECEYILKKAYDSQRFHIVSILDYYKGKPMKIEFVFKPNGRKLLNTDDYDYRNGRYRAFEAFLDTFLYEEIKITKKEFSHYVWYKESVDHFSRPKEVVEKFRRIIKQFILKNGVYGKYWTIDENLIVYEPLYKRGLLLG